MLRTREIIIPKGEHINWFYNSKRLASLETYIQVMLYRLSKLYLCTDICMPIYICWIYSQKQKKTWTGGVHGKIWSEEKNKGNKKWYKISEDKKIKSYLILLSLSTSHM